MRYLIMAIAILFSTSALADTKILIASSYPAVSTFNEQAQFIADKVKVLTNG